MIASFLLIGQSNMAGRGYHHEVPAIINEGIKVLRNGRWQLMTEPVHNDRSSAGIGLAGSFGAAWRKDHPDEEIGFIPCADGGTSLDDWSPGGALFDHALTQAKLAQRSSTLAGILWHQGESDCSPEKALVYEDKLKVIVDTLRLELHVTDVPFIIGGLGDFLTSGIYGNYFAAYPLINEALWHYARTQALCYYATAAGLSSNPDGLHFNATSLRTLGIRYYEAFRTRQHVTQPLTGEAEILAAIYNRPHTQKEQLFQLEHRFASGKIGVAQFQSELTGIQSASTK
ncbi:sialate O-acetylesterase [Chitinophaga pinensis]|uniref:Sialate O-acetylesterase n=1 Tax=Chitinophaga pinensis TaxID=79329 RepID=A0A5C6LHR2_9BACT|nr:sialate O-acetylesterase [Chitinophaga pinensis]TWV89104.1 sialate O-acetylesterase [Chitinophaga pinensis]